MKPHYFHDDTIESAGWPGRGPEQKYSAMVRRDEALAAIEEAKGVECKDERAAILRMLSRRRAVAIAEGKDITASVLQDAIRAIETNVHKSKYPPHRVSPGGAVRAVDTAYEINQLDTRIAQITSMLTGTGLGEGAAAAAGDTLRKLKEKRAAIQRGEE